MDMPMRRMVLYRGSIKSCNYHCSYCPFQKQDMQAKALKKDQVQWEAFVELYKERAAYLNIRALMVVPYGEAMLYPWYWRGLAAISAMEQTDAVGAQTNLSFSVTQFLACLAQTGGIYDKIRLWATFHPEMTTVSEFAARCRQLSAAGIVMSVGAVGVPDKIELYQKLREEVPRDIYMWINRMDGMKRPYTEQEIQAYSQIDPYFPRELLVHEADKCGCQQRLFVEGNGRMRTCNISQPLPVTWEDHAWVSAMRFPKPVCSKKHCSCYLAYGGREDFMNQALFGPYPLFRIPRRPKAVFFDIEGTLISDKKTKNSHSCQVSAHVRVGLEALAKEGVSLFFATTLPYVEAMKRCRSIRHLFQGGIFAGGAHLVLQKGVNKREQFYFFDAQQGTCFFKLKAQTCGFRMLTYASKGRCYKITLLRPMQKPWEPWEAADILGRLPDTYQQTTRSFIEKNCLQIVARQATKEQGVKTICQWLHISLADTFAAGDSMQDHGMMQLCGKE